MLTLVCASALVGCTHTQLLQKESKATSAFKLANVGLYVERPVLWAGIASDYQPKFEIEEASELLDEVAPNVGSNFSVRSRERGTGIQATYLGGQLESSSLRESSTSEKDGVEESSSSSSDSRKISRKTPAVPTIGELIPNESLSPAPLDEYQFDPAEKYRAATALYQRIKNLDNYLSVSYDDENKVAYLVRAKITVSPRLKNQPFDMYSVLTLDGSSIKSSDKSEKAKRFSSKFENQVGESEAFEYRIFPLLIADNIERVDTSRIQNTLNALKLGLGVGSGSVGASVGYEDAIKRLEGLVGNQVNSLVTLSQTSHEDLTIKVSAAYDPESAYSMREKTYDISFVVLLPRDVLSDSLSLNANLNSQFVNAMTGKVLPRLSKAQQAALAKRYYHAAKKHEDRSSACLAKGKPGLKDAETDMMAYIGGTKLRLACWVADIDLYREIERLHKQLNNVHRITFLKLDNTAPVDQLVFYSDNSNVFRAELATTLNKDMSFATATLNVSGKNGEKTCLDQLSDKAAKSFALPHRNIEINGNVLGAEFPSLISMGCKLSNLDFKLGVNFDPFGSQNGPNYREYSTLALNRKASQLLERPTQFEISRFFEHFIAGTKGAGANARLVIAPTGKSFPTDFNKFKLSVSGAELASVQLVNSSGGATPAGYAFTAKTNSVSFNNQGGQAYQIRLSDSAKPASNIDAVVTALDASGEPIANQTVRITFEADAN